MKDRREHQWYIVRPPWPHRAWTKDRKRLRRMEKRGERTEEQRQRAKDET